VAQRVALGSFASLASALRTSSRSLSELDHRFAYQIQPENLKTT